MGRVGVAKEWVGTQWPVRLTVVVVATLVLLSAPAGQALASHNICPTHLNSIKLFDYETAFIGTNSLKVSVRVKAAGCVDDTRVLDLWQLPSSNETSLWEENLKWYEFNFISCGNFVVKIGSETVKLKREGVIIPPHCTTGKPITLSVGSSVQLGRRCKRLARDKEVKRSITACKIQELLDFLEPNTDDASNILYGGLLVTPANPTYNLDDDTYFHRDTRYTRRNYKNSIPLFIGIVVFTVSMCLRFCWCRGKSVLRRVTTVTVIRRRPDSPTAAPQDQQDPPPSYVDVVNEVMSPQSPVDEGSAEPPPPAYGDIVDEVQPPTYSEVEAQSIPASEEASLADQEAEAHTRHPPPDPESASDVKGSPSSKNMLSKYRSQQKQFAFKVLEEDD